ncbi:Hypothetical protein PP7435_CHR4-0606 [Komagataella phaffii CBS 7435]|uniref:Uncharacterized protein n=2 Tax=Komagataella phaffii TaxID=460519 RepID=C4R7Q6_KOMPG|nr:Hypothetical protein PAS_chr4_0383 [Komagataella phaffii GS115]AOA64715.1 GQ67_04731T0 [Komagataella phaffii]CAH2450987.1 Hypothetical protein BQ9382_C4-3185 [Komagataella phaffii CBS 7435]AOA69494.1 GQ68_04703T0 [Komagataella phaffii GS115]CAY71631.1 Hypothetical protein PAS_chr4_0383 [Komagataella phaffii GS115]CCA40766.1 Hypothetical protein PP7435_CHR4-0606 [Komagataella phaffii CBS 7435]
MGLRLDNSDSDSDDATQHRTKRVRISESGDYVLPYSNNPITANNSNTSNESPANIPEQSPPVRNQMTDIMSFAYLHDNSIFVQRLQEPAELRRSNAIRFRHLLRPPLIFRRTDEVNLGPESFDNIFMSEKNNDSTDLQEQREEINLKAIEHGKNKFGQRLASGVVKNAGVKRTR